MEQAKNEIPRITEPAPDAGGFRLFAGLVWALGTSTKNNDKLQSLQDYFLSASGKDKVWVIAIFSGRRPRRAVNASRLQTWCLEQAGIPEWLFEESYHTVGDLAETIALVLPEQRERRESASLHYYIESLSRLEKMEESARKAFILETWESMSRNERFVFNKLITGGFRIGVSQKMMVNALAKIVHLEPASIAHRISGNWDPFTIGFEELLGDANLEADESKPYPFYLAYPVEDKPASLGAPDEWFAEWKWDGIRGQLIKRKNQFFVWSRGEELLTEKFPEYTTILDPLPEGTVLDGEIICLDSGKTDRLDFMPMPFAALQTRIGRKNLSRKQLQEAPVSFIAYDLLEKNGEDCRNLSMQERRAHLEVLVKNVNSPVLRLSPLLEFTDWDQLEKIRTLSRSVGSEGLMLKRKKAAYEAGRKKGDWWKWKIDPLVIDAVMIYAQKGHGRRSNLYTDYTFAVKDGEKLVSFTKAYSGLTDKELNEVDYFVKRNSLEKFGPVRTVRPELVFEIAFEGIAASSRHKSGVALRFPRISRWRKDKKPEEINTMEDLRKMLEIYGK